MDLPSVVNGYIHESNSVLGSTMHIDTTKYYSDLMLMDSAGIMAPPSDKPILKRGPWGSDSGDEGAWAILDAADAAATHQATRE